MKHGGAIKILIGLTTHTPDNRFLDSFPKFLKELEDKKEHYKFEVITVKCEDFKTTQSCLANAQNKIADYFLKHAFDFLLLIEDDNWGFSLDMLKALLKADAPMCAIHYVSRWFPYYSCCMTEVNPTQPTQRFGMTIKEGSKGYHKCDIVGWGMTLIKKEVFSKLEPPYFRPNEHNGKEGYATDINFCDRVKAKGMDIIGCFDYTLNHRDFTKDTDTLSMRIKFLEDNKQTMEQRYLKKEMV